MFVPRYNRYGDQVVAAAVTCRGIVDKFVAWEKPGAGKYEGRGHQGGGVPAPGSAAEWTVSTSTANVPGTGPARLLTRDWVACRP
ncbi:hypothetical protein GCM10020229_67110 [Kitasatospora albolonga]